MSILAQDFVFTTSFGSLFFLVAAIEEIVRRFKKEKGTTALVFLRTALTPYLYGWLGVLIGKPLYGAMGSSLEYLCLAILITSIVCAFLVLPSVPDKKVQVILWNTNRVIMRLSFACGVYCIFLTW